MNQRVKVDADGRISVAAGAETDIGTAARAAFAENEDVAVDLASLTGTAQFIADVPISVGDRVYGANGGEVGVTDTNAPIGIALRSAAAGKRVEVLRRQL